MSESHYKLPEKIEHYLAMLSKTYSFDGSVTKLQIIANAQVRIEVGHTRYEQYDDVTYGHAIFLGLPEPVYSECHFMKDLLEPEILKDLNKLNKVKGEFIAEIAIELQLAEDSNWRRESGMLLDTEIRTVAEGAADRIWSPGYRLFLSHKVASKWETSVLKEALKPFGISCFVAHEDIEPTKQWQDEIENALLTMDAFIAVMTPDFHDSKWTDQEVGFAVARGVPIIAIRLGTDPYGFIAKFQALRCTWEQAPIRVAQLLIKHTKALDAFIAALPACSSFDQANVLSGVLASIEKMSAEQATKIVAAFNNHPQVRGFGFDGAYPYKYGGGLPEFLKRTRRIDYALADDKESLIPLAKKVNTKRRSL